MTKAGIGSVEAGMGRVIVSVLEKVLMTVRRNVQAEVTILWVSHIKYEVAVTHASLEIVVLNFV